MNQSDPNGHIWDIVLDVASVSYDLGYTGAAAVFGTDEQLEEGIGNLSADAIGVATPFVTAAAAKAAQKLGLTVTLH